MARRRSLLPQLLVTLLTVVSILLAASITHTALVSFDADSAAVPPSAAFRGSRHIDQHHLFLNTIDDAEPVYPSSFSDVEAPSSLHNDEAAAKTLMSSFVDDKAELGDATDRNGMRALAAATDGTFPRHRAS
jgi:hypothetical protein